MNASSSQTSDPQRFSAFKAEIGAQADQRPFAAGLATSIAGHLLLLIIALVQFSHPFDNSDKPIVYSVTIDGGAKLGGVIQEPKDDRSKLAPPKKVTEQSVAKSSAQTTKEKPAAPDAEVSLATKTKPKATPIPKSTPTAKRAEKPKEPSAAEVNKELQQAMQRYLGESSNAGGKGFGAAALGGRSMGGGTVRSAEFIRYLRLLESTIKQGWHWIDPNAALTAQVEIAIDTDGTVTSVNLTRSSGNSNFDDSVVRAIRKASPVPVPPPALYEDFKLIRITFDPRE